MILTVTRSGEWISPKVKLFPLEIETSPGPVIVPLRMAKVWKVR